MGNYRKIKKQLEQKEQKLEKANNQTKKLDNTSTDITEILDKIMTSTEKSEYWYKYYIEHKQYNDDLEYNKKILKDWSNILKGMGNRNYPYCYAIDRILTELERSK